MKRFIMSTLICIAILISGCSIDQQVKPIDTEITKITVVENPKVTMSGFLDAYKKALVNKGCIVETVPVGADLEDYEYASTYTANWTWDLTMYMYYAQIKMYHNGVECGKATYDSSKGGLNMGKFVNAEEKVSELVDLLLPSQ